VLNEGKIKVEQTDGQFCACYVDHQFPLAPESLAALLTKAANRVGNDTLSLIADSFSRLPASSDIGAAVVRHRDKTVIYGLLKTLLNEHSDVCAAISTEVEDLNRNIDALDDLLNRQNYRLAFWRTADQELGYRRFFDVNTLIALRVGREHVFEATHDKIVEWLKCNLLDGIRVDHVDGLRNPLEYFERLRAQAPAAWIVGEKILAPGEFLRKEWPIDGTSGYDFMDVCNNLLVDAEGVGKLTEIYGDFTAEPVDFAQVAHEKKLNVLHEGLGSDVNRLASLFVDICENHRDRRDYTRAEIRRALREVASCFPVYRTYVVPGTRQITGEDRDRIGEAVAKAKQSRPDLDAGLFDFIAEVLTLQVSGDLEGEFVMRFQQFTSPVMAKGVEDTAFYCFNPMIGLNEVGNDPGRVGMTVEDFHQYCTKMQATHPQTMTTLSTHDTKRSDDVRARLATITEIPREWKATLRRWSRLNAAFRTGDLPDRNTEYFLYQTLLGAWPIDRERLAAYMEKATREAKVKTSWVQQNKEYETALHGFSEKILASEPFLADLESVVKRVLHAGRVNSLSQSLLKFTAPGVPDTYQGGELWDLSLVDPDNRRPVDYELRRKMLNELHKIEVEDIMKRIDEGMPKLWLVYKSLCLRKERPEWFGAASTYTPLIAEGSKGEHAVAFLRADRVAAIAPRLPLKLGGNWGKTTLDLPQGLWKNRLTGDSVTGGRLQVQKLLERFPVALLTREAN
jgi:(1->4)-alpha-D-glucan 1-alpha-D-glucosylmutase